jgi:hypothetical protein
LLDLSYPFTQPNTILKDAESAYKTNSHAEKWKEPLRLALDFVAQLSRVDGVVHMTSDLAIRGFGGKVMMSAPDGSVFTTEEPSETSDSGPGSPQPLLLATVSGMRHRSAAAFCANQPGQALAIVVSQDGEETSACSVAGTMGRFTESAPLPWGLVSVFDGHALWMIVGDGASPVFQDYRECPPGVALLAPVGASGAWLVLPDDSLANEV